MRDQPYRYEIVGTFIFAPLVLALETWRRWGELLSPSTSLPERYLFAAASS